MTDILIVDGIDVTDCPACRPYNVFGHNTAPCCYNWHKYCSEIKDCEYKKLQQYKKSKQASYEALQKKCNELELENRKFRAEVERSKHDNEYEVGALEKTIDNLKAELEQEQALKETYLACYRTKHEDLADKYEALKAENEESKEYQKLLEEQMKFNQSELELSLSSEIKRSEFLLQEFKRVDKQKDNWREKAETYKQTLIEINEIAKYELNNLTESAINGGRYVEILQKISEVLDERSK